MGLGIALQMADGSTRVLRMSTALERHLRREFTPFTLCSPADVKGEDVLRILLYQDRQQLPIQALLEKALGDNAAMLRSERTGMDVIVLTPGAVSAEAMLGAVCLPVNCTADQLTVAAGCSQMLELVRQAKQSVVPADAPVELRLAASQTTLTDHDTGAAAEFFYGLCEVPKPHHKDCVKSPANFPQETFFFGRISSTMRETMLSPGERRFLALAAAAAVCIVSLAFWYAVPPSPAQASSAVVEPLRESFRVDLNTAGIDAMTTLPGLGEKKARAILEYRLAHGRFQSLDEVAQVPGVTQDMIDEWQGLAYVS